VKPLRIATRGSALALWQANRVREALQRENGVEVEIVTVKTSGDKFAATSIEQIGVRGIFTKELEETLFSGRADIAVHSMKDVPTEFSDVCRIRPVFQRDDPRDALVARNSQTVRQLPHGARVGTSSLRRASQLRAFRGDLQIVEIRGNVDTRVRKVEEGECEAVVLAKAGLDRLGLTRRITEILPPEIMLPAVGQGVLCVEYLESNDDLMRPLLEPLQDRDTVFAVEAERILLREMQGGCRLPLGAWARFEGGEMRLDACVLSADGSESIRKSSAQMCSSFRDAELLGRRVAKELLDAGAGRLLHLARGIAGDA